MKKSSRFSDHSLALSSSTEESGPIKGLTKVGEWLVNFEAAEMTGPGGTVRLEPKVSQLLQELVVRPGRVVSREELMTAIWPHVVVGDDSLARIVSKLRRALGDNSRESRYIETISKRGYRLLAPTESVETVAAGGAYPGPFGRRVRIATVLLLLAGILIWGGLRFGPVSTDPSDQTLSLLARAEHSYFQFSRADNEAAIELYQRVLGLNSDDPVALAGLANALAQRSFRWPNPAGSGAGEFTTLGEALAAGHLQREPALSQLERARQLAERAVKVAPDLAATHKALGLVVSAGGDFDAALDAYHKALALDPEAWGVMINIGDVLEISGRGDEALPYFERAYNAMGRVYERDAVRVRPWHAELGVLIAQRHRSRGDLSTSEGWYRRVLVHSPLHPGATRGLAGVLRAAGDPQAAERLCAELAQRVGPDSTCR